MSQPRRSHIWQRLTSRRPQQDPGMELQETTTSNNIRPHSNSRTTTPFTSSFALFQWRLPANVKCAIDAWERLDCLVTEPNPQARAPFEGEQTVKIRGRLKGKIPKPHSKYRRALIAVSTLENPLQRWYYGWKIDRMRKCPLIDYRMCYQWEQRPPGQKEARQWWGYRGYRPYEYYEILAIVGDEFEIFEGARWKSAWDRRRPVSRTVKGVWRGANDAESVMRYREERNQRTARKIRFCICDWLNIQIRHYGTGT